MHAPTVAKLLSSISMAQLVWRNRFALNFCKNHVVVVQLFL